MSKPFDDHKKRPPPIFVPSLTRHKPVTYAPRAQVGGYEQLQQQQPVTRNASSSTQRGTRSASSPLTSPLEHDASRYPLPNSGSQKSRASAMSNLTGLMEQARASPHKSEQAANSTTRSNQSARGHHSAKSPQVPCEMVEVDERTSRAKIESRVERSLFKIAGQVPPTPIADLVGENEVLILRQDLRKECRAASAEQKAEVPEPARSPKKKLFGMHLPTFGRSSTPTPPMPSKAAQIFGQEPRNPTKVVVRPIKPAATINTPTKAPRSDTAKSLPAKLLNQDVYSRSHRSSAARRNRAVSRRSPTRTNKQPSNVENTPPAPGFNSSFDSAPPPTPPKKDTPPDGRPSVQPTSPLRRTAPSDRLRESYGADLNVDMQLRFPAFALSPTPSKHHSSEHGVKSPTKHIPSTADEYQKLIAGQALLWPSPTRDDPMQEQEGSQDTSTKAKHKREQSENLSHRADRWSAEEHQGEHNEQRGNRNAMTSLRDSSFEPFPPFEPDSAEHHLVYSNRESQHYSPLQPRFYSPPHRSVHGFTEGETPSKNSDTSRLLCTAIPKVDLFQTRTDLFHFRQDSNNGSIDMMFQGEANEIDPQSSTGHLVNNGMSRSMPVPGRDDSGLASRVMQELRIGEKHEQVPRQNGTNGHLQPDQSSSRLTDMLNGVSPRRDDSDSRFLPNCPSAVPSPLHRVSAATPMQAMPPRIDSSGLLGPARTPKSIEDHFFMTNEHLDVVGKSNWDQIETLKNELHETFSSRNGQLVTTVEKHVQEIKMQVDSVNEKADRTTEQGHNIHTKLEKLFDFVKGDVMGIVAAQDKKATNMELMIKELQNTVQGMQKTLEAKTNQQHVTGVPASTPNPTSSPFPLPGHRSQPSLAGYYGNMTESGREGQPPMPHMGERNSSLTDDGPGDPRVGYGSNYGQQWAPRSSYQGRGSKEERPYSGTNPYQFTNTMANGGQFGIGYSSSYGTYSPPEPQYGYHSGPTK